MAAGPCVDDEALYALARGELKGDELRASEAHLRDCADCRAVLAEAARSLESDDPGKEKEPQPTRIARYEIAELIGAGASGVVYRALDPQLRRAVALKLLRPELHGGSPEQSQRLLREAQAMARLSDSHVVTVYDVGLHEGSVYLVMEFIDGVTLSAWLRERPRALAEILGIFEPAARGLLAAHHSGLVHRDFKPENVLVTRDGRAKVLDFGLARESDGWLRDRQLDDQASTELYAPTRGLVGTPAYMAPELFEGGRASAASDQFAYCVALFVAVFERHPFRAGEGIALSELIARVRGGTLEVPSFASSAHERVFRVLRRGLSPLPSARFSDLSALVAELGRAQRGSRQGRFLVPALLVASVGGLLWARVGRREAAESPTIPSSSPVAPVATSAAPVVPSSSSLAPPRVSSEPRAANKPSPTAAPSADKRRAPKPSDVRYKDWLKDPFSDGR